jgi:predicted nucleic acid-binding protein
MKVYLDSSVLLRVVLREPGRLQEWPQVTHAVSSQLLRVECLRVIDRARAKVSDPTRHYAWLVELHHRLAHVEMAALDANILEQASQSFPLPLGTLDALHLATAMAYRRELIPDIVFATHDRQLKDCATAMGFKTLG